MLLLSNCSPTASYLPGRSSEKIVRIRRSGIGMKKIVSEKNVSLLLWQAGRNVQCVRGPPGVCLIPSYHSCYSLLLLLLPMLATPFLFLVWKARPIEVVEWVSWEKDRERERKKAGLFTTGCTLPENYEDARLFAAGKVKVPPFYPLHLLHRNWGLWHCMRAVDSLSLGAAREVGSSQPPRSFVLHSAAINWK